MANSTSAVFSINSSEHSIPINGTVDAQKRHQQGPPPCSVDPSCYQRVGCILLLFILAETLGTFIFIFMGCGAVLVDREKKTLGVVGLAIVPGLTLMTMIYTLGHISGAHFNPAVTIALAAARKLPLKYVPMYVLSQLIGSTVACLSLRILFRDKNDIVLILTQYSTTDVEKAILWEFIITFILMFTICGVASDDRANNEHCGVAIGAILIVNILIAGPITGASMNPARSIGPALVSGIYKNQWVYVVAPILGAISSSLVYNLLRPAIPGKRERDDKIIYNDLHLHSES